MKREYILSNNFLSSSHGIRRIGIQTNSADHSCQHWRGTDIATSNSRSPNIAL